MIVLESMFPFKVDLNPFERFLQYLVGEAEGDLGQRMLIGLTPRATPSVLPHMRLATAVP
jgi:hypothetical protein